MQGTRLLVFLLLLVLPGCCSSEARLDAARILDTEYTRLEEAWLVYRSATIPHPGLDEEGQRKVPEIAEEITEAIRALGEASRALSRDEGVSSGGE